MIEILKGVMHIYSNRLIIESISLCGAIVRNLLIAAVSFFEAMTARWLLRSFFEGRGERGEKAALMFISILFSLLG